MRELLTFDDVLLEPQYSCVLPAEVSTETKLNPRFKLSIPLLSAAMDTVTESKMAIAIAQSGGLGVVHKNFTPHDQALELEKVKRYEGGIVYKPVTVRDNLTVAEVRDIKDKYGFSGLPVVNDKNTVVGIVTNRDLRFEKNNRRLISEVMTPADKLVTVGPEFKIEAVKKLLQQHRIERVVMVDNKRNLLGLVTVRDILNADLFPNASKDEKGRLRVAAAVGVKEMKRVDCLVEAGVDILVVDSAHGHSQLVLEAVKAIKKRHAAVSLMAGNVATAEGARALARAGADMIKVGIGPGSICTTRMITGVGVPQVSAIQAVSAALSKSAKRKIIIADGGLRYSGDIVKAIAAGADAVMVGGMLAGTEEAPGEIELYQGRAYKSYRGMGSLSAMKKGSSERYFQSHEAGEAPIKLVPEGVEGRVPYKGKVSETLHQLTGGLRSAMGYLGAADITALQQAKFVRVSAASIKESHVHDIEITRESPNYQI